MKSSLIIAAFFLAGIAGAFFLALPAWLVRADLPLYALYGLLLLVGIGIGGNTAVAQTLKRINLKILLVPLFTIIGTLAGVGLVSWLLPAISLQEALAVGAGFGYYSLSSIIIGHLRGETLGVIALLANILREIITLLLAPLLARYGGRLAPIAAAGATAMDTTLPVITRFSGVDYAVIAVFSGLVLTILVPVLVTFILSG